MTLKQFFQLAGGFLAALIFYSTPLLPIIKWPFVILSAILGVALAFLPLEERPLERWIFAFFKAIYAPTMYFWQKTAVAPSFFQPEPTAQETASPQGDAVKEYLSTTAPKTGPLAKLEGAEKGFLSTLAGIFSGLSGQPVSPVAPVAPLQTPQATVMPQQPAPVATVQNPAGPKQISIPQTAPIKVVSQTPQHLVVEEKAPSLQEITTHQVAPLIAGEEIISTKQAMFSVDAAPPNPPTTPNVVVGQVVDENRKIIEGAIMEIKDSAGRPTRALRSNKVGHFVTVTPLETGKYDIITDKDGYEFTPVSFEAIGQLIPPILVQGHKLESRIENIESGMAVQNQTQTYAQ
jgi:hypothetical protein